MFSFKRMNAIFIKDYKDFSRNIAVFVSILVVPSLAGFYGRMGVDSITLQYMLLNMAFATTATFVQSCLIAEEKEKNTLRGLMLSPASTAEILVGKSLLSFVITVLVIVLSAFFLNYMPQNIWIVTIAMLLSTVFYIGLGTLLGLYTKSVMEASVAAFPVMIIFGLGTLIIELVERYPVLKVLTYLPNLQLQEIAIEVEASASFGDIGLHLVIIIAWVIFIFFLTIIIYRKRMID